ncbi:MAG: ribosome biogenesis GTPase Der, partial [bacterium]|nr:ribosome biogenesis GTPase Der [bacterium]
MYYVAIIGRPNVGKSTLFNYLVGQRISIVEDTPGVTRDRIYADVEWTGKTFTMVDTGGLFIGSEDALVEQVKLQAQIAIEEADVILFLVDGRQGITSADKDIAEVLRNTKKPIVLAANKLDNPVFFNYDAEFFALGLGAPIGISAINGLNLGDLLDQIIDKLPKEDETSYDEEVIKIAVIGRPNVGKSSLVNAILGENRVIVSAIPGTTRDAVDSHFVKDDEHYVIIDTAGLRRKSKVTEDIERFSVIRSLRAIDKADVCLVVLDPTEGILEQDKKIIGYAHQKSKGIIFVF